MLSRQADKVDEGMEMLVKFLNDQTEENAKVMDKIEKEADELRRVLVAELNKSFVTPIDREDIFALSRVIDDVVDYANTTVEEVALFGIKADESIKKMVELLHEAAHNLNEAIVSLGGDKEKCLGYLLKARKTENAIEHCYREGLVKLFEGGDVMNILKTREVYRHLSNAADKVVEAADITSNILVKIT